MADDLSEENTQERHPHHFLGLALVLGLIAGLGYLTFMWFTVYRFYEKTDNAYLESDITLISPRVAGWTNKLYVDNNQAVKAGQLLLTLDDKDFSLQVNQSQSALEAEKSALNTIDSQIELQQSVMQEAEDDLKRTTADATFAGEDFDRISALSQKNYTSVQSLDQARTQKQKAETEVIKSKSRITQASQQLIVLNKTKLSHEANIEQLQATLDLAKRNQAYCKIYAPIDGVVGNKAVNVGELIRPGQNLLSIVPLPYIYVVANYKETQLARMALGQEALVSVDALPDVKFTGKVLSFSPASGSRFSLLPPENATGNFNKVVQRVPVTISITGDQDAMNRLKPGMSVVVSVDIRNKESTAQSDYISEPSPGTILNATEAPNLQPTQTEGPTKP